MGILLESQEEPRWAESPLEGLQGFPLLFLQSGGPRISCKASKEGSRRSWGTHRRGGCPHSLPDVSRTQPGRRHTGGEAHPAWLCSRRAGTARQRPGRLLLSWTSRLSKEAGAPRRLPDSRSLQGFGQKTAWQAQPRNHLPMSAPSPGGARREGTGCREQERVLPAGGRLQSSLERGAVHGGHSWVRDPARVTSVSTGL